MNEQELKNKRRAEWAGWYGFNENGCGYPPNSTEKQPRLYPIFDISLDACFKWLVLDNCSVCFNRSRDAVVCLLTIPKAKGYGSDVYTGKAEANEDTLAFCEAMDKHIDYKIARRR